MRAKEIVLFVIGASGGFISKLYGGWSLMLQTLVLFMLIDYAAGMVVAGVFKKSRKTADGTLESRAGWKGLCRKGMTLLIVLIAHYLDLMLGLETDFVRDAVGSAFIANEALSIIENAGLMGIPIPAVIANAISVLKSKSEKELQDEEKKEE